MPTAGYFATSAVFHYLGPAFAVMLFTHIEVLGVAWLRIAVAALVFALWRRPWRWSWRRPWRRTSFGTGRFLSVDVVLLGVVLAAMNSTFYLAIARLPLATVGAIEFLGVIGLALVGLRTRRNVLALAIAIGGVIVLADVRIVGEPIGFAWAFVNCGLFVLYVVLGHRVAAGSGIDGLAAAMLIAVVVATPIGIGGAVVAFTNPLWLLAGVGVGVCSSVIPYVTDQLAMARMRRETFALWLCVLPAMATVIGFVALAQLPALQDLLGIGLVVVGVALHRPAEQELANHELANHELANQEKELPKGSGARCNTSDSALLA